MLYPHAAATAAKEIKCEYDFPVTYVKAVRHHNGAQETVHVFRDSELQLFPARALRDGNRQAITGRHPSGACPFLSSRRNWREEARMACRSDRV